ncbi:hypothetical protein BHM03_00016179 [Ensete ventricosum]|nr:hypothetical protein BHM03_00016179 [Ensete ventricosum]
MPLPSSAAHSQWLSDPSYCFLSNLPPTAPLPPLLPQSIAYTASSTLPSSSSIVVVAAPSFPATAALKHLLVAPAAATFFLSYHYHCLVAIASRHHSPSMHSHLSLATAFFLPLPLPLPNRIFLPYRCSTVSSSPTTAISYVFTRDTTATLHCYHPLLLPPLLPALVAHPCIATGRWTLVAAPLLLCSHNRDASFVALLLPSTMAMFLPQPLLPITLALMPFFFPLLRSCFNRNHRCRSRQRCCPSSSFDATIVTAALPHLPLQLPLPLFVVASYPVVVASYYNAHPSIIL